MNKADTVSSNRLNLPIGRKCEKIRKLRGFTQEEVAEQLGISKQAYSKLEQSDDIDDTRLTQIASALGVTVEGLKSYHDDLILANINNFHEQVNNCTFNSQYENHTTINNPVEKIIELYEELLKTERKKVELLESKLKV